MGRIEKRDWITWSLMVILTVWTISVMGRNRALENNRQEANTTITTIQENHLYNTLPPVIKDALNKLDTITGNTVSRE